MDTPYHRNRLRMVEALLAPEDFAGHVVDFGCGDGIMARSVLNKGGTITAIDIDSDMVATTRHALDPFRERVTLVEGGVESLQGLPDGSADTLLALNVLSYLSPKEDNLFYENAARILRQGGALVCTHSNELFDMFTLNKYTVAFFQKNFFSLASFGGGAWKPF